MRERGREGREEERRKTEVREEGQEGRDSSGVATLGHAGAHALATSGRAPPVQR